MTRRELSDAQEGIQGVVPEGQDSNVPPTGGAGVRGNTGNVRSNGAGPNTGSGGASGGGAGGGAGGEGHAVDLPQVGHLA